MRLTGMLARGALCIFLAALGACGGGNADSTDASAPRLGALTLDFEGAADIDPPSLEALSSHEAVRTSFDAPPAGTKALDAAAGVLETPLPHSTQAPAGPLERHLLRAYLDHPRDGALAAVLGLVSLNKSLLGHSGPAAPGDAFKHTLLARYFLGRAKELGRREKWIDRLEALAQARIDQVVAKGDHITSTESHPAHAFFNRTFNEREGDRYAALERLLDAFVAEPKNVYTAFAVNAANLWIGGEADYDDPTTLQNFVIGSWFSIHAMNLSRQLEVAWLADHSATPRFRMASILGGFSILQRRWLAKVHGDEPAVAALDQEHREWRLIHRSFHAFTVGLAFYNEPQNFAEGLHAWGDALPHCQEVPVRTCSNLPRFSHNFEGFLLGYVDFLLKAGQVDAARQILGIRHVPDQFPPIAAYAQWDLGRASWEYREAHAEEMAALHANGDPSDDPMHFMLKKKRWGQDTATCQLCHQAQSSQWTEAQKNEIVLPPEPVATVGNWPAVSTTWYGTALAAH